MQHVVSIDARMNFHVLLLVAVLSVAPVSGSPEVTRSTVFPVAFNKSYRVNTSSVKFGSFMLRPSYIRLSCNTGAYALMAWPAPYSSRKGDGACGRFQSKGTHEQPGQLTDHAVNSGRTSRVMWCGVHNLIRPSVCELHLPRWRHYCLAVRPTHHAGLDDTGRPKGVASALPASGASGIEEQALQCNWTFVVHHRKRSQLPRLQTVDIVYNGSKAQLQVPDLESFQGGSTGSGPGWSAKLKYFLDLSVVVIPVWILLLVLPEGFAVPGPHDSVLRVRPAPAGHRTSMWLPTAAMECVLKFGYGYEATSLMNWALQSSHPLGGSVLLLAVWYWLARPGRPLFACARAISVAWRKLWKVTSISYWQQRSAALRGGSVHAERARRRQGRAGR